MVIIIMIPLIVCKAAGQTADTLIASGENKEEGVTSTNTARIIPKVNDTTWNSRTGKSLALLEALEGGSIDIVNYQHNDNWDHKENKDNSYKQIRKSNRFRGHWTGIELGFNNYMTSDNNMSLPDEIGYMTLNSGKSTNFNINFTQISLGLGRHIGFVSGLGLNWNNYRFDRNNSIIKNENSEIVELDPGVNLKKSKLATLYMTLPVLFEMQIPANGNHLSIAAGPIFGLKLESHTKMVYYNSEKVKSHDDFSLNMLRYGGTVRVGYSNFMVFGTCYKTPLFQSGKGPGGYDLYPFEVGLAFTFNN